jgi:asparagine synthase (glutamine-hydrolysing)
LASLVPGTSAKKGLRNTLKRLLEGAALPAAYGHQRWMVFLSPDQRAALYRPDLAHAVAGEAERTLLTYLDNPGPDRLQRAMNADLRFYLPENILPKVDLMSMAASLEARVPYLDDEVVRLALRIPSALKLRHGVRKWILRRAYADQLPAEILARGKEGFSIPMKRWLAQEWRPLLHDLLSPEAIARDGLFEPRTVARLITEHESGRANHSHLLWALLVLQLWKRAFGAPAAA